MGTAHVYSLEQIIVIGVVIVGVHEVQQSTAVLSVKLLPVKRRFRKQEEVQKARPAGTHERASVPHPRVGIGPCSACKNFCNLTEAFRHGTFVTDKHGWDDHGVFHFDRVDRVARSGVC